MSTIPPIPPIPPGPTGPGSSAYGPPPAAPPTCYRHPDRESYVRCQRCGRPICPDCQIPAAVGFQCPDCVAAGRRTTRPTRTTLGGIVPRGDGALVTKVIIAICAAVYVVQLTVGDSVTLNFGMIGAAFAPGHGEVGIADGQYYRLITAAFLHASVTHILVNMVSLWFVGPPLERMLGRARFLTLYILGALGGTSLSYLFGAPNVVSVGASGAIFAVFGALIAVAHRQRVSMTPYVAILALNAVIGFLYPGIDWRAHVGGLCTGLLLGAAAVYAPPDRRRLWQGVTVGGTLLILLGIVVFRTAQLG